MNLVTREALLSFRRTRTLSILSITTIAFALFVTGLFGLVALNLRTALRQVAERVQVVAVVKRDTPSQQVTAALSDIAVFPEVFDVQFVSETQALVRAQRELTEFQDVYKDLEVNPLPPSIELTLKPAFRDGAHAAVVAERLRAFDFVDEVKFGQDWVQRLDALRDLAGLIGLAIGLAFALVSIVIIGVTIRITVLQRAREIHIMRLVGATLRNLEEQRDITNQIVNGIERRISGLGSELDRSAAQLTLAQDNLADRKAVLQRRLADIYRRGPLRTFQVLLAAESFGDL
ncbi:MAG: permease-like cell division protein FtsX, partial [Gemmatimonadota bacterium]